MSKALLIDEDALKSNIRMVIEEMVDEFWERRITRRAASLDRNRTAPQIMEQKPDAQSMNDRELQSIYALFAWVADEQDTAKETVQSITEIKFGVDDITGLPRKDYDEVIRFLVDLRIDELRN